MNGGGDVNMKLMAKGARRSASGSGHRPALKLVVLGWIAGAALCDPESVEAKDGMMRRFLTSGAV